MYAYQDDYELSENYVRVRLCVMKKLNLSIILMFLIIFPLYMGAAFMQQPQLDSPKPGDVLQGRVLISGLTNIIGFQYAEVLFAYENDVSDTWFLIDQVSQPANHGQITEWDTTILTDGRYRLRLLVFLDDGTKVEDIIGGLQVRNYSEVEPTEVLPTPLGEGLVVTTLQPTEIQITPTNLPENPAKLTPSALQNDVLKIGIFIIIGFLVIGIILVIRALVKRV